MKPIYYTPFPPVETSGYPSAIPTGFHHPETPKPTRRTARRDGRWVTPGFNPAFLLLALLLYAGAATAQTTIRVSNGQSLSAIIASAAPGSTLLIEAGVYGDITINKRLNLVGPGYFLAGGSQATLFSAILGTVKFVAGSDQSTMTGIVTNSTNDLFRR